MRFSTEPLAGTSASASASKEQSNCSSPNGTALRNARAASAPVEADGKEKTEAEEHVAVRKLIHDLYSVNLRWFETLPLFAANSEARRLFGNQESLFDSFLLTCFQLLDESKLKQLCERLCVAMGSLQSASDESARVREQVQLAEFFQVVAYLASEFAQARFSDVEVTYLKLLAVCNPGSNALSLCSSSATDGGFGNASVQLGQLVQLFTHICTQFHLLLDEERRDATDSEAERAHSLQKVNTTFKLLLMLSRLPHKTNVQKLLVTLINSDKDDTLVD